MTPARFEIGQKHKQENEAGSKAKIGRAHV